MHSQQHHSWGAALWPAADSPIGGAADTPTDADPPFAVGHAPAATSTITGNVYNTVILGTGNYGATLTIAYTGSVQPAAYGAAGVEIPKNYDNTSLTNYGTIAGADNPNGAGGIGVYIGGNNANITNAGKILGGNLNSGSGANGLDVVGAAVTVTNTGTIVGGHDAAGVIVYGQAGIINNAGLLSGSVAGVILDGADNTLTNTGTIYGYDSDALQVDGQNEIITNSGRIYGQGYGVGVVLASDSSATFTNTGHIGGGDAHHGSSGLYAGGTNTVIVNRGEISGGAGKYGGGVGVDMASAGITIDNFGSISGGGRYGPNRNAFGTGGNGINIIAGGTLINAGNVGGGSGIGYGGNGGLGILFTDGFVDNSGGISGGVGYSGNYRGGPGGNGGAGVKLYSGATLTNTGGISGGYGGYGFKIGGSGGAGVYMTGGTLINAGVITGGSAGFSYGHHHGGSSAPGVFMLGGTLMTSGTISGGPGASAVACPGNATVVVEAGAVFNGDVVGNGTTGDIFEFAGSAPGTLSGIGTSISGFQIIDVELGSNWTLTGTNNISTKGQTLNVAGTLNFSGYAAISASVTNAGTISASGGDVILGGQVNSTGMLLATGGGTLNFAKASFQGLSNGVFSGSTLRANAGSTLEMLNNATIVTDAGNITLDGAGSSIEALNTETKQQVTLDSTLDATTAHGTLSVIDGRNFTVTANGGTFTDAGKLVIEADTFAAAQLNVSSGGTVMGWGKVSGAVTDQGLLAVTKQSIDIIGSLTVDTGTFSLAQGSEMIAGKGVTFETSSVLSGPGTLSTTGPITITTTNGLAIGDGATWINSGTVTETGAISLNLAKYDSMAIVNEAGAVFNLASDGADLNWSHYGSGADNFSNAGTLIKSGGTGASTVDTTLTNTGLVVASSGTLFLGSAVSNSGSLVADAGSSIVIAGGLSNTGSVVASSGVIQINSSVTNGGTISASAGTIDISNYITNSGMLLATNSGTIDLATGSLSNLANGTLTGGTLRANAGSVIQLANNTSIVTDQGNITLSGTGAVIESLNTATGKQVLLDSTLSSIASSSTLSVVSGRNFTATANGGSFSDAGTLILQGGDFSAATLSITTIGTVSGSGTVAGAIVNAGDIVASKGALSFLGAVSNTGTIVASAEALSCAGKVTGAGLMEVGSAGTLMLLQGAGTLQTVDLQAGGAMLDLGTPVQFNAEIAGFGTGDAIDLLSVPATSISYANNVLTVEERSRTVASLHFQGTYQSNDFTLTTDGNGGALIRFV